MDGNQIAFNVIGGQIQIEFLQQYESRGDSCSEMLHELVKSSPELFEGRQGTIFYGDAPPATTNDRRELRFCTTIRISRPEDWLPFPCFASLRWPEVGVADSRDLLEKLLIDDREWVSSKIFWIGTDQHPSRVVLRELAKQHPGILDVELMEWDRANPKLLESRSRQVSIPDHRDFKYLVDCQGRGYSARLKWLVATGRPVFVVDRDVVEPWFLEMKPWVNFVPVAADLSDLFEHHARLERDPELYEMIGRSAREFAAKVLRLDVQLAQVAEAIRLRIMDRAGDLDTQSS